MCISTIIVNLIVTSLPENIFSGKVDFPRTRISTAVFADVWRKKVNPETPRLKSAKHKRDLWRGDLSVCPLGGLTRAHEHLISDRRGVPQGSPQGQTQRALLLRGTSVLP